MKCECSGDFRYVGTMSKEHTHHIVIECVKCKKAHNIFYFKDLAEEQEARAEKAEAEVVYLEAKIENILFDNKQGEYCVLCQEEKIAYFDKYQKNIDELTAENQRIGIKLAKALSEIDDLKYRLMIWKEESEKAKE